MILPLHTCRPELFGGIHLISRVWSGAPKRPKTKEAAMSPLKRSDLELALCSFSHVPFVKAPTGQLRVRGGEIDLSSKWVECQRLMVIFNLPHQIDSLRWLIS